MIPLLDLMQFWLSRLSNQMGRCSESSVLLILPGLNEELTHKKTENKQELMELKFLRVCSPSRNAFELWIKIRDIHHSEEVNWHRSWKILLSELVAEPVWSLASRPPSLIVRVPWILWGMLTEWRRWNRIIKRRLMPWCFQDKEHPGRSQSRRKLLEWTQATQRLKESKLEATDHKQQRLGLNSDNHDRKLNLKPKIRI